MKDQLGETLNMAEAAEFLRLGYESTKDLFERGELPGTSLNQKHVVFLRDDLVAFLREKARQQAAERRAGIAAVPANPGATKKRAGRAQRAAPPDLSRYEGQDSPQPPRELAAA